MPRVVAQEAALHAGEDGDRRDARRPAEHRRQPLQLLIDVKSEAATTWRAIDTALRNHPGLLTRFTPTTSEPEAVTAVISGNRDLAAMTAQTDRRAGYDGRLTDLGGPLPSAVVPSQRRSLLIAELRVFVRFRAPGHFASSRWAWFSPGCKAMNAAISIS